MVNVTEKAAGEILRTIKEANKPEATILRIKIAGGGCSGLEYNLVLDENGDCDVAKDVISDQHGLKVAVDKRSLLHLDGTTIDYYDGIEQRGFTFNNPNATKSCGCGNSFST